jgi:hypothetical protein
MGRIGIWTAPPIWPRNHKQELVNLIPGQIPCPDILHDVNTLPDQKVLVQRQKHSRFGSGNNLEGPVVCPYDDALLLYQVLRR